MNDIYPPLISIIIAVFNGAKTLQQCIDSIAMQSYPNKELIIIDGGSDDGTVALLESNNEQINYWVSERDSGIYSAWNKGLSQAKGTWICFLGADDFLWDDNVLLNVASELANIPADIRLVYGQIMLLNNRGESLHLLGESWEIVRARFQQTMCIPHPGLMHHRSLFEQRGKFDESFRIAGDYELLLRELKFSDARFMSNIVVVGMRQGGVSSTPENSFKMMQEMRRGQCIHGLPIGKYWLFAMVRVYLRLLLWTVFGEKCARKLLDLGRRIMGLPAFWTKT